MLSDPTYDFQINQFDRRWTIGGRYVNQLAKSDTVEVDVGSELRYDRMSRVGVDHTLDGAFVENLGDNAIREGSGAAFIEVTSHLTERLRLMTALRGDYYTFTVDANPGAGPDTVEGSENSTQVSPKAALAYSLTPYVELYANWGRGFHSNDARGVITRPS